MKIKVQPIICPDREICNVQDLFFRTKELIQCSSCRFTSKTNKSTAKISFNTYFNSFSAGKWIQFTNINNAFLNLIVHGSGVIRVLKSKLEHDVVNEFLITEYFFDTNSEQEISISLNLDNLTEKDTVYFEAIFSSQDTHIESIAYWIDIDDEAINSVSLALASCTYKKEKYINKTLSLINKYVIDENPDYNIKTYIVDNGGTLDFDICDKYKRTTLVKSENLGASGGFSRALYCAIQNNDTHVVSLDDDILLNPYSVNLLYNFLRCLKSEYNDYAVAGAMLIYDKQYLQHDSGAYIEKNRLYGIHSNLDLRLFYNCLLNSVQESHDKTFNGFWFCCYPVSSLRLKGLAYPFFMKGDDVELGIRIFNKKMLSLNGICTWHESFYKKFTPVYSNIYELRNLLIIYSTQFNDYSATNAVTLFIKRSLRELFFYRYQCVDLNCKGVKLFLEGTDGIKNIDNAKIVKENQVYKLVDLTDTEYKFSYESSAYLAAIKKEFIAKRLFRLITFNGNLIPGFLLKKNVIVPTVTASMRSVFGYKNIIHYDADDNKIYVTKNSKRDFFSSLWKISKTSLSIFLKYKKVKADYISNFSQLTSVDYWEKKFKQSDRK